MSDERALVLLVLFVEGLIVIGAGVLAATMWRATSRSVRRAWGRRRVRRGEWPYR